MRPARAWCEAPRGATNVQLWDYALADAQIIARSGGGATVESRRVSIVGPDSPIQQYWAPPAHNAWAGDTMLTATAERLHLFWLFDRRMGNSKFGCGAHQFAHADSTDLQNWEHRPLALAVTEPWEASLGTACVVPAEDGMHLFTYVLTDRLGIADRHASGLYSALAHDEHGPFIKQGFRGFAGEPGIVRDPDTGIYHAVSSSRHADGIWRTARYESPDLNQWRLADPDFLPQPGWPPSRTVFSCECFCWFAWRGWWYIIGGRTAYWKSRSMLGPYRDVNFAGPDAPQWDVYDGLIVPQAAVFRDRAILAGWLVVNPIDYAGHLVFRELLQNQTGDLYLRRLPELEPPCGPGQPLAWQAIDAVGAPQFARAILPVDCARLRLRIDPRGCPGVYGLRLSGIPGEAPGADLIFDPAAATARWATPRSDGLAEPIDDVPYNARAFTILGVDRLREPITLDMVLHRDAKSGSIILDAQIDDRRTIITRRSAFSPVSLTLLASDGVVSAEGTAHCRIVP